MALSDRQAADMRASQAVSEAHGTLTRALAVSGGNEAMAFRRGLRETVGVLRGRLIEVYAALEVATEQEGRDDLIQVITDRVNAFIQSSVAGRRGPNAAIAAREGARLVADNNVGIGGSFDLAVYDNAKNRQARPLPPAAIAPLEQVRVLFLSANPDPGSPLAVEKEQNRIVRVRDGSKHQERIRIESLPDLDISALAKSLRSHKPRILHFCGHGIADGSLLMRDHDGAVCEMHPGGLAKLLVLQNTLRLVVLNACYSSELAELLIADLDCVIGMNDEVDDEAAILFSQTFYSAVFDGSSVGHAFAESLALVAARYPGEEDIPEIRTKAGVDATTMVLVG